MKARLVTTLAFIAVLPACAPTAQSVAYDVATDVKKSECWKLSEPRRSDCFDRLRREMDRQEALAEEMARERESRQPRQAGSRDGSVRERLEEAADD